MAKTKYQTIPLNGKLITAFDGAIIGVSDTQVQKNLRYNDGYIQGVRGMTKINTAAHATYRQFKTGIHFQKENPYETHILCQASDINNLACSIIDNKTAPPSQGNFEATTVYDLFSAWAGNTAKVVGNIVVPTTANTYYYECIIAGTTHATTEPTWGTTENGKTTDGSVTWICKKGDLKGKFALAPDASVVFANGKDTLVYGGDETRCGAFLNSSGWTAVTGLDATLILYDYSDQVSNMLFDSLNVATLKRVPSGGDANTTICYVGFPRPVKGIKWYVKTPNATAASTPTIKYWGASGFAAVSNFVDGTLSSTTSLAVTGTMTFDDGSTNGITNTKPRVINNTMAYWYQVTFPASKLDETTVIYYVTGVAPMQPIVDLWDGSYRDIGAVYLWDNSKSRFEEYTSACLKTDGTFQADTYSGIVSGTGMDLRGMTTDDAIYVGSEEPLTAINVIMFPANYLGATKYTSCNTTASSALTIAYWDGETWTTVADGIDGTSRSGITLNQSGMISWTAPGRAAEVKTTVNNGRLMYLYKITTNKTLSSGTSIGIDQIQGIPAPLEDITGYIFPLNWADALWLCGKWEGKRNEMIPSDPDTVTVWNTDTTLPISLGDDSPLRAGTTIYSQFGGSIYDTAVIVKDRETWILNKKVGSEDTSAAIKYRAARKYGCNAPYSLDSCDLGTESSQGMQKAVAIWQSNTGLVMFDGNAMTMISDDIWNLFRDMYDTSTNERVHPDYAYKSQGFFDPFYKEYHWMFADGSSTGDVNRELCYDVVRKKWFEIVRGTGKELQTGFGVWSREGNAYSYGGIKTGYLERLEYGTTHDGTAITYKFRLSDSALAKDDMGLWKKVRLERVELIMKSKNTTGEYINVTLYADGKTVGTDLPKMYMSDADRRFVIAIKPTSGYAVFCTLLSLEFDVTTDDEQMGFTPYAIGIAYTEQVDDLVEK